jgi:hypothetical protein
MPLNASSKAFRQTSHCLEVNTDIAVLEEVKLEGTGEDLQQKEVEPRLHAGQGWLSAHMGFQAPLQLADARCTCWCFTGAAECWGLCDQINLITADERFTGVAAYSASAYYCRRISVLHGNEPAFEPIRLHNLKA